ncbi:DNA-directed RNA polymerase subunit omega [Myxococcota bacterium]|nr:DNA-directed RNA polymerase subunit omega [Myxococcota bacterium]
MARITIEDCMEKVPNRFHLVRMASIRAKQLKKGARPLLTADDNKEIVMSLREIAAGLVKPGAAEPLPPKPVAPVAVAAPRPVPRPAPAAPAPKARASIDWDDELEEDNDE